VTRFAVDLAELEAMVAELARCEAELTEARSDVDRVAAELRQRWDGAAAAAHQDSQREWAAGDAAMRDALTRLRDVLALAHENYTAAVSANRTMWAR